MHAHFDGIFTGMIQFYPYTAPAQKYQLKKITYLDMLAVS